MNNKILGGAAGATGAVGIAMALIMGLEGNEYVPYQDVVGVWTVCYGHTGKDIVPGKNYTEDECKFLLDKDLKNVAWRVDKLITRPIPNETRGALYSFVYNVGSGAFSRSTMLVKLNKGDVAGTCDQLRRWTYAGGKQWKGLMNRREIEREVCMWGVKPK